MPFVHYEKPSNQWSPPPCRSPEHNPPGNIVLRPGTHTWKCPKCEREQTIVVNEVSLRDFTI